MQLPRQGLNPRTRFDCYLQQHQWAVGGFEFLWDNPRLARMKMSPLWLHRMYPSQKVKLVTLWQLWEALNSCQITQGWYRWKCSRNAPSAESEISGPLFFDNFDNSFRCTHHQSHQDLFWALPFAEQLVTICLRSICGGWLEFRWQQWQ